MYRFSAVKCTLYYVYKFQPIFLLKSNSEDLYMCVAKSLKQFYVSTYIALISLVLRIEVRGWSCLKGERTSAVRGLLPVLLTDDKAFSKTLGSILVPPLPPTSPTSAFSTWLTIALCSAWVAWVAADAGPATLLRARGALILLFGWNHWNVQKSTSNWYGAEHGRPHSLGEGLLQRRYRSLQPPKHGVLCQSDHPPWTGVQPLPPGPQADRSMSSIYRQFTRLFLQ